MKPIIYQLFPRTFTNANETRKHNGSREENGCGKFEEITPKALAALSDLGVTHVWYTGVIRHATAERNNPALTKGQAGSPYAITDYYDVNPDLAVDESKRMAEFEGLVRRTHKAGLKVIMDFVPNHVSREYKSLCKPRGIRDLGRDDNPDWAFSPLNNFYYLPGERFEPAFPLNGYEEFPAKVTGNDCFSAHPSENDWYETVKLNYGVHYLNHMEKQFTPVPSTWEKMLDILKFWSRKGIDAFRVDMAEMVPVEFFAWAFSRLRTFFPDVKFIGECYNPALYRSYLNAGFDWLYDKVGMYEYLRGVTSKSWPAEGITARWQAVDDIRDRMLYFLENHDEQRIASGFFCGSGRAAEPAMVVAATLGTNPVMVYAGQELGETGMYAEGYSGMDGRSSIFDYWGIESLQAWCNRGRFDGKRLSEGQKELRLFYKRLLTLARDSKAVSDGLMYDLEYAQGEGFDRHEQYAYIRKHDDDIILFVLNFRDRQVDVTVRIPQEAFTYLGQPELRQAKAVDILSGKKYKSLPLTADTPVQLSLPAWTAVALKIEETKTRRTKKDSR